MPEAAKLSNRVQLPSSRKPRVLILGDKRKSEVPRLARKLKDFLREKAHIVGVDLRRSRAKIKESLDLVLVLGGDGAILAASHRLDGKRVPVMGINFGSVGFLAAVAPERAEATLGQVLDGAGRCENRAMMRVQIKRKGKLRLDTHILNDVVLSRGLGTSLLGTVLHVDRQPISSYRGDGVVLSTATGSTAYSLSAGGPILAPNVEAWVVTPIAPHMVGARPLVLPGNRIANFAVDAHAILTADGHVEKKLLPTDVVKASPSGRLLRLIVDPENFFYARLRRKLHWGTFPSSG
ncbi:MAG TPA: hypothetical protein DDW23_04625 [Planctomycetes bacterium]|nr:hypothetical protein [Planctomycetota bacterium]